MQALVSEIEAIDRRSYRGRVVGVRGMMLEAHGPSLALAAGARAFVGAHGAPCEVIGFSEGRAVLMPLEPSMNTRAGEGLTLVPTPARVRPSHAWLGRVIDGLGSPVDGGGPLVEGDRPRAVRAAPPPAASRGRLGERLDLGVSALNLFAPVCKGQRMGLFAGSGVGKSVLMSMLARGADADVVVIGLIGERGREVREFVEDALGADGLARSVVVVATSDEPALKRRQAAEMTMAVAEHFRDEGAHVLCLMDSVTRFALAQREIGLAAGEPPTTRGYTPSVFAELPRLLERAGPGPDGGGAITAIFTVLVDGGDHDEPVADAVRGVLDGHVVMSRAIAERGRYPAIDILKSLSRAMPGCASAEEVELLTRARRTLASYADMEELIRLGAYSPGANPEVDEAIRVQPQLEALLSQRPDERVAIADGFGALSAALAPPAHPADPPSE